MDDFDSMGSRVGVCWLRVLCALCCGALSAASPGHALAAQETDTTFLTIRSWIDAGQYVQAEAEAERLFQSRHPIESASIDPAVGDLLVEALIRNGRGAEMRTRQLAGRVVSSKRAIESSSLAVSLRNLSDALSEAGDYQSAEARLTEALTLLEGARASPALVADALDGLARVLTRTGRYTEALPLCNRAVALREDSAHPRDDRLASSLLVRAYLLQQLARYPEARVDLERARSWFEEAHATHPETARALTLFGEQLSYEGSPVQAREVLTRALAMSEATLRPDHPSLATSLRALAVPLLDFGDLPGARTALERAVAIAQGSFGPDHPNVAIQLNDLANVLLYQGDYSAARPLYERAARTYERSFGRDYVGVTAALFNLAILNSRLRDFSEARRQYERVIETWERVLGNSHPNVARGLTALAETLVAQGLDREARTYFERAVALRERSLGVEHPSVAVPLSQLAATLSRLGDSRGATRLSERALGIWERSGAQQGLAGALITHARVLLDNNDYVGAAQAYGRALDIRLRLLGASHPGIADIEVPLAAVQAHLQNRQDAFSRALRGDEIARNHSRLTLAYLSERQALEYVANRPKGLDLALSLIDASQQAGQVFDALIRGRSLTLDEIGSRRRVIANQGDGSQAALWTDLSSARQRLANLVVRGPGNQTPAQYNSLVDEARREKEQAERVLAEQSAAFRSEQARAEIGLEQVRAALPAGSALVSFVRFNRTVFPADDRALKTKTGQSNRPSMPVPSYLVFVLRAGSGDPTVIPLGRADAIEPLISRWRSEMMAGISESTASPLESERTFGVTGATLRRRLWDPIAIHLEGASRIFVVPDDAINLVPLAALPTRTGRYLLEDGPITHYLSVERDLAGTGRPLQSASRGLLAVGGAAFADGSLFASIGRGKTPQAPTPPVGTTSATFRGSGSTCGSFQAMRFAALPASGVEAREVADLWHGFTSSEEEGNVALIGRDASEQAVKQLGPGRRILHLATHGFFLGDDCGSPLEGTRAVGGLVAANGPRLAPAQRGRAQTFPENPLLLSGLALAGANRRAAASPQEDDGILTAEEVTSLNLEGVEWAVLSACDTGLGQLRAGEGIFGLRRAFQVAGARTVIMSLWPVEDRAARLWMRSLYTGRLQQRLDTAEAVRQASLSVLRDRRARQQSTHPFYWAGFVAAGDWR